MNANLCLDFRWQKRLFSTILARIHTGDLSTTLLCEFGPMSLWNSFHNAGDLCKCITTGYTLADISRKGHQVPPKFWTSAFIFILPPLQINCKSDVWSLGCILYSMVYGRTPFQHIVHRLLKMQAICNPEHFIDFQPIENELLLDVMKVCITAI